mgnify:CR=1 FL=1
MTLSEALANAHNLGLRLRSQSKAQEKFNLLTVISNPTEVAQIMQDSGLDQFASFNEAKDDYRASISFEKEADLTDLSQRIKTEADVNTSFVRRFASEEAINAADSL